MGTVIIRALSEEEYLELKKAQSTLNKILSKWDDMPANDKNLLKEGNYDKTNVIDKNSLKESNNDNDNDILNKYPIEVNSFSSIFQIDLHLISNKVRMIWNNLNEEDKRKAIKNSIKFKNYENSRLREPNLLYYLQDKKFNWIQFNK